MQAKQRKNASFQDTTTLDVTHECANFKWMCSLNMYLPWWKIWRLLLGVRGKRLEQSEKLEISGRISRVKEAERVNLEPVCVFTEDLAEDKPEESHQGDQAHRAASWSYKECTDSSCQMTGERWKFLSSFKQGYYFQARLSPRTKNKNNSHQNNKTKYKIQSRNKQSLNCSI